MFESKTLKDPDKAIASGVLTQVRFPRDRYADLVAAAAMLGMPLTTYIRSAVLKAVSEQKRNQK
jgi:hypothetical protein